MVFEGFLPVLRDEGHGFTLFRPDELSEYFVYVLAKEARSKGDVPVDPRPAIVDKVLLKRVIEIINIEVLPRQIEHIPVDQFDSLERVVASDSLANVEETFTLLNAKDLQLTL